MPTIDGGHYFLTLLVPVLTDPCRRADGSVTSPVNRLREELARLPTAEQSAACVQDGRDSPFTRNLRNHFVRFALIDNVAFNGRLSMNTLKAAITGNNPVVPQHSDCLSRPYLFISADFDAMSGRDSELDAYLEDLWRTMGEELRAILSNCVGFDQVNDARSFIRYIRRCQIETTMPFNDYWTAAPLLPNFTLKDLLKRGIVAAALAFVGLWIVLWAIFRPLEHPSLTAIGSLLLGVAAGLTCAYVLVMRRGAKPFPTAPNSDLPTVLKSLYLQQAFTRFAMDMQGVEPARLHEAFGAFLRTHRPADVSGPTQRPGIVRADALNA